MGRCGHGESGNILFSWREGDRWPPGIAGGERGWSRQPVTRNKTRSPYGLYGFGGLVIRAGCLLAVCVARTGRYCEVGIIIRRTQEWGRKGWKEDTRGPLCLYAARPISPFAACRFRTRERQLAIARCSFRQGLTKTVPTLQLLLQAVMAILTPAAPSARVSMANMAVLGFVPP